VNFAKANIKVNDFTQQTFLPYLGSNVWSC